MTKQQMKIQDVDAHAFYGSDNRAFDSQVAEIAGHDPRLLAVFQRTRAWYAAEKEHGDSAG